MFLAHVAAIEILPAIAASKRPKKATLSVSPTDSIETKERKDISDKKVWDLPGPLMPKHVIFEVTSRVECLVASAMRAPECSMLLVNVHVDFQALIFTEWLIAARMGAPEGKMFLGVVVAEHVQSETSLPSEGLLTACNWAVEILSACSHLNASLLDLRHGMLTLGWGVVLQTCLLEGPPA